MGRIIGMVLMVLLSAPQFVYAVPDFWLEYSDQLGPTPNIVTEVKGAAYLEEENDPDCSVEVFVDEIKRFVRQDNGHIAVYTRQHKDIYINASDLKKIDKEGQTYITSLLRSKERMLFIGEMCGSSSVFTVSNILKVSRIDGLQDRRKPAQHK